ncbi:WASH complex subunit 2A isoform X2 [Scleropages formosus]|uniref:WASH complex subunit 2A isoform X2 n=1 Tax=Scleropages formosus TaxID=113540 RepID=UPI0010FAA546|nr:WASH complex subunit 2A-like isoform X2 [Scleropages formosus]
MSRAPPPPSSLANGPSQRDPDGEQLWERPWSPDEMRRSSATWSLAADSGLFLYLQDFSQRMLSKTHDIEKQLDGLLRDTKATDCHLHTVFNDFLMLSNTQFIENRVYDEEVEEAMPKPEAPEKQPEQEKTREQKEAELIPKVQEAVNYGLRVLESAFEQLDIKAGNSDSEDEEAIGRVEPILEPKDLYLDRPLPYLIGSQLFMEQDNVGLGDLSSEEMSIDSERDSVIDSEEDKDGEQSDEDFDQDDTGQGSFTKPKSSLSDEEEVVDDEDEDSDIFGESDKEGDEEGKKLSTGSASFADELAARIRGETPSKPEGERSVPPSIASKKKSKVKKDLKAEEKEEIFQPPPMEDAEHSPFGSKGGLFSGGRGLFDDDDEGDLFSEAPKQEAEESSSRALADDETVLSKPNKKIPAGAVSIFPGNSLFGSPQGSDSSESRESRCSAQQNPPTQQKAQTGPKSTPGSGLFDDEDEDDDDDDFFSGNAFKKSSSALEKHKQKKVLDLFGAGEDDEEGDIFSENFNSAPSGHSKKPEEDVIQVPQKKLPAGATSMFSPGTTSLLQDAVRRRQPSIGDESQKPREDITPVNSAKTPAKAVDKPQVRGLFSDDEDSQIFPSPTKSPPKPDPSPQIKPSKASKAPLSLFDDEEEQDLFASAPVNVKTSQAKNDTLQKSNKVTSSSLFSDDEDQWMSSVPEVEKPVAKTTGTTSSLSKQPAVKAAQKNSLFDDDEDDDSDLFAATKESSKKKAQRVSLLFEEEDETDEDKGSLFSFKSSSSKPILVEKAPSILDSQTKVTPGPVKEEAKEATKQSPSDNGKARGHPAGAVSLFGGIDVLGDQQTVAKVNSTLGNTDQVDAPPPMEEGPKPKKTVLSLFDDDEEDDDEHEETAHTATPPKTLPKKTQKPQEQWPSTTSTRVFQDEELLFSQTQQKDNDPDVDLFAPPRKSVSPKGSSARPAATSLFGEDDEDDSIITARPKVVQKPAVVIKSKEPSSRIGKLQVNLAIDPSSLLPGAVPRIPGTASALPHPSEKPLSPTESFPSLSSSSASGSTWEGGVSFDIPAQVTTLQSANKSRPKGAGHRRPQTRAARLAAQQSDASQVFDPSPPPAVHVPAKVSELVLPTHVERVPAATEDTFKTDNLYTTVAKTTPKSRTLEQTPRAASLFDSHGGDRGKKLFQDVKQTPVKRSTAVPFLDDEEEDFVAVRKDTDVQVTKETKTKAESPEHDIFQDEVDRKKAPKKAKERTLDAGLFDDDIDIFADLTATTAPVEKKSKKKVETKSIFDDDMDDIFSSGPSKPVTKQAKSKRSAPAQEPSSSLFDDPLNALGGK